MQRTMTLATFSMLAMWVSSNAASQEIKNPVGTWRIISFSRHDLATGKDTNIKGENPTGFITYTPGGHVVVWLAGDNRKPQAGPVGSDAERLSWFQDIISGYSGTYSIDGNKVVHHVQSAWVPDWYGTDQTRYFAIDGSKLVIKTAPFKSTFDGREVFNTLVFERVE